MRFEKGYKQTPEHREKNRLVHLGQVPWNKGLKGPQIWISDSSEYRKIYQKKYRHEVGISKNYYDGRSHVKGYKGFHRAKRRALNKNVGELSISTIQLIYEDNIKRYGTLTCYLCLNPVPFKKDHLEHKTPLSRGGTNEYCNLAIACQRCNCSKSTRTEEEYYEYKKSKEIQQ